MVNEVSNVALSYDLSPWGGEPVGCSGLSTSIQNATVQDIMNVAACGCDHKYFSYTAQYIEGFGNKLLQLVNMGAECLPSHPVNLTQGQWTLHINKLQINSSMSSTSVKSGDSISWTFNKPHSLN